VLQEKERVSRQIFQYQNTEERECNRVKREPSIVERVSKCNWIGDISGCHRKAEGKPHFRADRGNESGRHLPTAPHESKHEEMQSKCMAWQNNAPIAKSNASWAALTSKKNHKICQLS
jgi:hypothetical protein